MKPVSLLPFKANTAKQSHGGGGRKGAGRQTDGWPRPPDPSSNKPDTKEAASDNTNSTMIGSDGSQSAAKSGGVIIDCFFCWLLLIEGGGGDWRKMMRREKLLGQEEVFEQTNIKKNIYTTNTSNLIGLRRGRKNFHM